jgi:hypothetical protein
MRRLLIAFVLFLAVGLAIQRVHPPAWVLVSLAVVVLGVVEVVSRLRKRKQRQELDTWRQGTAAIVERRLAQGAATGSQPGRLVAGILNSASSRYWAKEGYGRRAVFLFQDAVLVLETNRAGKPLGMDQMNLGADDAIVEMPLHAREMAELDSRNALFWVRDVRSVQLSGRRKHGLFCLDLRLADGREFSFHWMAKKTWHTIEESYAFPIPDHAERVAVKDLRTVFGSLLVDNSLA